MPAVLAQVAERMRGVVIESRPAHLVLQKHDGPTTLHYVDPPYPHSTRGDSSRWNYVHEMSDEDHRSLAVVLHRLEGMVVVSGYPCWLYDAELYADWHRVERQTHADGARDRTEVLWLNPAAWAACPLNPANAPAPADPSLFGEVAP
jgi:DNA adenine methylase